MARIAVLRTYLQLLEPSAERDAPPLPVGAEIEEERPCSVLTYRTLYSGVGGPYHWRDRLTWSDDRLAAHLARTSVRIWTLRDDAGMGGYFELERHTDGSVEIAYFGLLPSRHGRGLGRALLEHAIEEGWRWGANRLWLHTCTLDGPAALPNYRARGFSPFRTESYEADIPDA